MFIVIDGPDGVGKTTIAKMLVERINEAIPLGKAIYTTEPTHSQLGLKIREILNSGGEEEGLLARLFVQDRADHVTWINEVLSGGSVVVCDRYKYSTVVYQQLQGGDREELIAMNAPFPKPDMAFVLQVKDVSTLLDHLGNRGGSGDIFENRQVLIQAVDMYSELAAFYPELVYIDADRPMEEVISDIWERVMAAGLDQTQAKPNPDMPD